MPYTVPNTFATQSGNVPASQLDTNFTTLNTGLNNVFLRGLFAARPAPGSAGSFYFATDTLVLYADTGASWVQMTFPLAGALRGYLAGATLSNDLGTPLTVLDVSAGVCCADDNQTLITLAAITGSTAGTWVVGNGNNKLDAGAIAPSTPYHVFAILRTDTGVSDILFSLSPSAPALPPNYTKKRRIGSFKTDGASAIIGFIQDGDYFRSKASVLDVNTTNPGVAAVTQLLASVPTGVSVEAVFNALVVDTTPGSPLVYFSDLAVNDEAPIANAAPLGMLAAPNGVSGFGTFRIRTNTSGQIRYRLSASNANTILRIATLGWYDTRGRFA